MITGEMLLEGPEPKLELIGGRLVCGSPEGSVRVLWMLLESYGADAAVVMADSRLWLAALERAFHPVLLPQSPLQWQRWAQGVVYSPGIPEIGGRPTLLHGDMYQRLAKPRTRHFKVQRSRDMVRGARFKKGQGHSAGRMVPASAAPWW